MHRVRGCVGYQCHQHRQQDVSPTPMEAAVQSSMVVASGLVTDGGCCVIQHGGRQLDWLGQAEMESCLMLFNKKNKS